jgi:hypothetical protein
MDSVWLNQNHLKIETKSCKNPERSFLSGFLISQIGEMKFTTETKAN